MPTAVFHRKVITKKTGYLISIPMPIVKALGSPPRAVEWIIDEEGSIKIRFIV